METKKSKAVMKRQGPLASGGAKGATKSVKAPAKRQGPLVSGEAAQAEPVKVDVKASKVLKAASYVEPNKEVSVTYKDGKIAKFSGVKSIVVTYWGRSKDFDRFFQQRIAR